MKQKFKNAFFVSEHLSLSEFRVACQADFIRHLGCCELLLSAPYHRYFGNRIYPVRNRLFRRARDSPEHVRRRKPTLLHRSAGQRREANYISRRIDVGNVGLEERVDGDFSSISRGNTYGRQIELITICLASDRIQNDLPVHDLAAFEPDEHTVSFWIAARFYNFFAQAKHRAHAPKLKAEVVDDLAVGKFQQ